MSVSNVKAGKAWWQITADDQVTKTLDKIAERLSSFGKTTMIAGGAIAAAGAAIVGPVIAAAQSWSNYAGDLEDASLRTGIAVESLSTLNLVAGEQGASTEALSKGLIGMAKFADALAGGSKEAADALQQLGLSQSQFLALSPEDRFKALADGVAAISDPTLRATVAMKAFGKSGVELLPMLASGSKGIEGLQAKFDALGLTVSSANIGMFAAFGDELSDIGKQLQRAWQEAGAALIEAVMPFLPTIKQALAGVIAFMRENRGLVKVALAVGAAMVAAGTAIVGVGGVIAAAGAVVSGITAVLGALPAIVAGVSAAFAFLAGPVGIAIAAIAGIAIVIAAAVLAFVQLTDTGAETWESVKRGALGVWQTVKQVVGGIASALMAGEWGLAARIAWQSVVVVFESNVATLKTLLWGLAETLVVAMLSALRKIEKPFADFFGIEGPVGRAQRRFQEFAKVQSQAGWKDYREARAELDKLTASAEAARAKAMKAYDFSSFKGPGKPDIEAGTSGGASKAAAAFGMMGTFSATVAGMLGSMIPDAITEIADNSKRSADTLDRIETKVGEGGLAFE